VSTSAISVCIVCRDEADKLPQCLQSVVWADEVIVMDLESGDGSAAVAEAHGAHVVHGKPSKIVETSRNKVAALARNDWVLAMDPDERVTPGLAAELMRLAEDGDVDVVMIPFMNYDLGHPPTSPLHRYNPKPRMYRRSRIQWPEIPNALPDLDEHRIYRLPQQDEVVMIHDRNRTIVEAIDRVLRYAPAEAQAMVDAGRVFSAREMMIVLGRAFRKQFFYAGAFKEGMPGVVRGGILIAHKFYVWAAFWQLSGARKTADDDRYLRRLGRIVESVARPFSGTARVANRLRRIARR
jgi:glycosyltransferase involved in cell wall biosynthesis